MSGTTAVPDPVSAAVEPNPVSDKPESDGRPASLDPSFGANPQFPNPNFGGLPSGLTPLSHAIQYSVRPGGTLVRVPVTVPSAATGSQFLAVPAYQTPGIPPPGVSVQMGSAGLPQVPMSAVQNILAPMRFVTVQNGYAGLQQAVPPGAMPPPGVPRYPTIYGAPMVRPAFPPRPVISVMPPMARPVIGVRGLVPPVIVKPPTPAEKPQTTVYVGKISSTVENDFLLSLLQLCGPVKSWKRPQDPTGTLKGFGFCEFESAEGVLRALRLLNKLNVDGQELMLNVNQPTRVYLNLYVERKGQSLRNVQESNAEGAEKDELATSGADTNGTAKSSEESDNPSSHEDKKNATGSSSKENSDSADFGLVTEEDRQADREALEKLKGMLEERLKNRPLPPPPPVQKANDGPNEIASELRSASKDQDSDGDLAAKDSEGKITEHKNAESRPSGEIDKTGSPDRSRRGDRGKDRDRESKRDKERDFERYDREREQERAKREKEYRSRDDDRRYKMREKEWEAREREKEHWRKKEREREKDKAQERKWEVLDQERDTEDAHGKKRRYRVSDNERKRRQQEKEEDLADRLQEEEEIIQAKIREEEEKQKKQNEMLNVLSSQPVDGPNDDVLPSSSLEIHDKDSGGVSRDEGILLNGVGDDYITSMNAVSDAMQNSNVPMRKLGFGLSGSGKRTAVPSVFNEDEDEDAHKEKKMRPLVPIDYSTEEQQAVQSLVSEGPHHVVAAAEFAKRIDKHDHEKEKRRRSHDRHEEESHRKDHRTKTSENQKFLDAKQLIDTIPKTKDELFSYKINWAVYDQNTLYERLRPWIAKKITDFLGEEEDTLVDYIVSGTQEHVSASDMLERLQTILDDEAEMFVLKMWRMLIFEIKKVETGLAVKSRS